MLQQTLQNISRAYRAMTEDYEREIEQKGLNMTNNLVEELEGVNQACDILFIAIGNRDLLVREIVEYARDSE